MLEELYNVGFDDTGTFGKFWCFEGKTFPPGVDTLVARFPKNEEGGDGQDVEIYCYACPARFYTIKALPSHNSVGEPVAPFALGTGSGPEMAMLAFKIAKAVSSGMMAFHPVEARP